MAKGDAMAPRALRGALSRAREQKILSQPELAESIKAFQFWDRRAKANTDTEKWLELPLHRTNLSTRFLR
jgi:hypothetical protein